MSGVMLLIGVVIGVVATAAAVIVMMRTRMVSVRRSARSFEETCAAVERSVPPGEGWSFPMEPLDMNSKLAAKGFAPENVRRTRAYFVCKPAYAQQVLRARPEMSAIMPCSWSVYELADGTVWLAKMNVGLMAMLFADPVRTVMGRVASEEERYLAEVLGAA